MDPEKIGIIIKNIRRKEKLTQKEFAKKYNVSFQAVSKWENGKNIPDISLLKQICKDNNISLDEILDNKTIKKNYKDKKILFLISGIVVIIIVFSVFLILQLKIENSFEFKKISTTCSTFKITGSVAYNKDNSSLYISNVEFCGDDENIKYAKLEYTLYESYNNTNVKISSGELKKNITLVEYLKELKISVDNYSQTCKSFKHSELFIEIDAYDESDKITSYKIPLSLEENCD
jgi:transcriptional regulator with XRE-family HTH domain